MMTEMVLSIILFDITIFKGKQYMFAFHFYKFIFSKLVTGTVETLTVSLSFNRSRFSTHENNFQSPR